MIACASGCNGGGGFAGDGGAVDAGGVDDGSLGDLAQQSDAAVDGGGADGGGVTHTDCETLAPLASGTCAVTAGDEGRVLVGDVLVPNMIYRGGRVVVDTQGTIVHVGCKAA